MTVDLLIRGARVFDGGGNPPLEADIAIRGDRIVAVGHDVTPAAARRVIDARGLAAAPGFVDIHGHSDYHLLLAPTAESAVLQGVTCEIGGNCGYAAAPIWGPWWEDRARSYREVFDLDHPWHDVGAYFRRLLDTGISINFGLLVGHNTLRGSAMGGENRSPTAEELQAMVAALERGMDEGALGLSTGLVYAPACFSSAEELGTLTTVAGRKGGILATHMRSEGDGLLEAIQEVIAAAEAGRTPLQISHLKTYGERNWEKLPQAFELIESAQRRGVDVTADRYPYTAANTGLQAALPRWAIEGNKAEQTERLKDPAVRARIRQEIGEGPGARDWSQVMISEVTLPHNRRYLGLRVDAAARLADKEILTFVLDLLHEEKTQVDAIYFTMSQENLRAILRKPYVMIGSDSGCRAHYGPLSTGHPHPRTFGTFARVLGHYVREEHLFDLSTAIRKMTSDPCRRMGLADRGWIRPGSIADIVLFDPDRVQDSATYEEPIRYPVGVHTVLVNGVVTVEAGEHTGVRAGRIVRKN
ncbi:MAG: D-aminoacylase [candidate division NC10 bacterium]|nr:D-aminoacylase [candidate division NC10 bacterium]MBI2562685.1 D-aminoacylase [candidate division NC10 bacterium]